jgi:multiple sugar transport system substrate-binding protein
LPWSDPRVVDTLKWLRGLIDAGLLPTSFTSLKLGEAHTYFHTNPGAVMFLNGSWYTSRAFNPPDKGGQPKDFPLGIMKFPAVPGAVCPNCRTLSVQGSYVANADTKRKKEVLAFFNAMATEEAAIAGSPTCWCRPASRPTLENSGRVREYFKMLAAANQGATYYFGAPTQ